MGSTEKTIHYIFVLEKKNELKAMYIIGDGNILQFLIPNIY